MNFFNGTEPQLLNMVLSYGYCRDCGKELKAASWCNNCEINYLKGNFYNWTSDCSILDNFIRHTQINAKENMDYLEWIDFNQFDLIKFTKKQGAFSSIYSAIWMEGPRLSLDENADEWIRNGPTEVILK